MKRMQRKSLLDCTCSTQLLSDEAHSLVADPKELGELNPVRTVQEATAAAVCTESIRANDRRPLYCRTSSVLTQIPSEVSRVSDQEPAQRS
jgi:hypothetical protein